MRTHLAFSPKNRILLQIIVYWNPDDISCTFLNYIPPVYEVIIKKREVVACPKGCQGEIKTAPKPKHILPKAKFTESVLAHIIVSKLDDRQPYYHLEKQFKKHAGFDLSRSTMPSATIKCTEALQPLVNLMKDEIIDYDIGALDATGFQVLNEPGRSAQRKSYAYCIRGGPPDKESIIYSYNAEKHKQFVNEWFEGFSGALHCDGDPFFELMFEKGEIKANFCNAHSRRKFEPIAKATLGDGLAKEAMRFYKRLYKIERKAKDQKLSSDQRHALRQEESKPLMDEFKQWLEKYQLRQKIAVPLLEDLNKWLDQKIEKTSKGGLTYKAMFYTLNQWEKLIRYCEDGRLHISNAGAENVIRPFAVGRRRWLFCDTPRGAKGSAIHYSLIETAKANDINPDEYYHYILPRIAEADTVEKLKSGKHCSPGILKTLLKKYA
ncbi:MAG: transposase [Lentisphaeria bacterium]